jgi:hypothetical protein
VATTPGSSDAPRPSPGSLIDELTRQLDTTRRLLTSSPDEIAERALAAFTPEAELEARLATSLAAPPLADTARFPAAHRLAIHALEVLDREGARDIPAGRRYGPLRPFASIVLTFIAQYITRGYARSVAEHLAILYARREAQCQPGTPERSELARARVEMQRLLPGFAGGGAGVPALVAGGALVPLIASLSQYLGAIDFLARPVIVGLFGGLFVLFFILSSLLLAGARHAHRRATLIMGQPLHALWATIGNAGYPPDDDARLFATIAIMLSAVVWIVIPAAGVTLYLIS